MLEFAFEMKTNNSDWLNARIIRAKGLWFCDKMAVKAACFQYLFVASEFSVKTRIFFSWILCKTSSNWLKIRREPLIDDYFHVKWNPILRFSDPKNKYGYIHNNERIKFMSPQNDCIASLSADKLPFLLHNKIENFPLKPPKPQRQIFFAPTQFMAQYSIRFYDMYLRKWSWER